MTIGVPLSEISMKGLLPNGTLKLRKGFSKFGPYSFTEKEKDGFNQNCNQLCRYYKLQTEMVLGTRETSTYCCHYWPLKWQISDEN